MNNKPLYEPDIRKRLSEMGFSFVSDDSVEPDNETPEMILGYPVHRSDLGIDEPSFIILGRPCNSAN